MAAQCRTSHEAATPERRPVPLVSGAEGSACCPLAKRRRLASPQSGERLSEVPEGPAQIVPARHEPSLMALADGPYLVVARHLGARSLCSADATCRRLRELNGSLAGPWQDLGTQAFCGMEVDIGGRLECFDKVPAGRSDPAAAAATPDWKARCRLFCAETPNFSAPFAGREITAVAQPDEVAYCGCRVRTDVLARSPGTRVYVEVEILANADNLSLAVVDFESGGRSSVTFSPETGAVLRERKVRESPRAIEGTYIHVLPAAAPGRRFEGHMGLLVSGGHLAFFRRWAATAGGEEDGEAAAAEPERPWETTGFVTDLRWAQGRRLSVCLAFRDEGAYNVRITRVCSQPPVEPVVSEAACQEQSWSVLYGDDEHPLVI